MAYEFGNDPAKLDGYMKFWSREPVRRPLVGFSTLGWFPLREFSASSAWPENAELTPDMVDPEAFMDEQEQKLREGEYMDDDVFRGACPSRSVFWCCATLGCRLRVMPGNVVAEDQALPWEKVLGLKIDVDNLWFRKYLDFIETLVRRANGRFPVSHSSLQGPLDYAVALRGHEQTVIDMFEEPERARRFLDEMTDLFLLFTDEAWKRIPRFHGGCFDAQYLLWAPGTVTRMQEDAIALMSPDLYREFVLPLDRRIASRYEYPFIHLHATSMIVLDQLLDMEEMKALEINHDVGGPPIETLIGYLRKVQEAGMPLIVRIKPTDDEMRKLVDGLDPAGLFLHIMAEDRKDSDRLRPILGM